MIETASNIERQIFANYLESYNISRKYQTTNEIFDEAFTSDDREKALSEFFKDSFGKLLKIKHPDRNGKHKKGGRSSVLKRTFGGSSMTTRRRGSDDKTTKNNKKTINIKQVFKFICEQIKKLTFWKRGQLIFSRVDSWRENTKSKNKPKRARGFSTARDLDGDLVDRSQCSQITKYELAEALGLPLTSTFVNHVFRVADADDDGYLSKQEFIDVIIILTNGSPEERSRLLLKLYDTDKSGTLDWDECNNMLRSLGELNGKCRRDSDTQHATEAIFSKFGLKRTESIDAQNFLKVFTGIVDEGRRASMISNGNGKSNLKIKEGKGVKIEEVADKKRRPRDRLVSGFVFPKSDETSANDQNLSPMDKQLELPGKASVKRVGTMAISKTDKNNKNTNMRSRRSAIHRDSISRTIMFNTQYDKEPNMIKKCKRYIETYKKHIAFLLVFYVILFYLCIERVFFYAYLSEDTGIRQVLSFGILASRGTAGGLGLLFGMLFITMSRNFLTMLRESWIGTFIPIDSYVDFHKQVAWVTVAFAAIHSIGHVSNFSHIANLSKTSLSCLFPMLFANDGDPSPDIFYYFYSSSAGITGLLLVLALSVMAVFAQNKVRRFSFRLFWGSHLIYYTIVPLILIHGMEGIIQEPRFLKQITLPIMIFSMDKLISKSRAVIYMRMLESHLLPSKVVKLILQKPINFVYKSGQWLRICVPEISETEFHPFSITSSPHEGILSVHIRAVGPWTNKLRERVNCPQKDLPKVRILGPFGECHQNWFQYNCSVMIGAGIGVTPFASILKDVAWKMKHHRHSFCRTKKMYFIWVTRSQKQYEWLTDIIHEVERVAEEAEMEDFFHAHIYITQFYDKFDLRTTMLYLSERHFQKSDGRSLLTGLKATTHFGRPNFQALLNTIQTANREFYTFGVFSSGPPGITKNVEVACKVINKNDMAKFIHTSENF